MARYRLRLPIVGVERSSAGMRLVQIGAGEILIVPDTDQDRGLAVIAYQGMNVNVFIPDVTDRGDLIERIDVKPTASVVSIQHDERKVG